MYHTNNMGAGLTLNSQSAVYRANITLTPAGPSKMAGFEQPRYGASHTLSTLSGQVQRSQPIVSPRGWFSVAEFLNLTGEAGWPVRTTVTLSQNSNEIVFVRLVLGKKPLATAVTQLVGDERGVWQLDAITPSPNEVAFPPLGVPVLVQALRGSGEVMDSLLIGRFTYTQGPPTGLLNAQLTPESPSITSTSDPERISPVDMPRPPSFSASTSRSKPPVKGQSGLAEKSSQVLKRTRPAEPGERLGECRRVTFELLTPLDAMCSDFTDEEIVSGRRLIRFESRIQGSRLRASCALIKQEDYVEGDAVVSCIYRSDDGKCYFTSVDIICLLERLVGEGFEIEEKNRIRRNLEGFHPETVSKNRKESEDFFQQIMEFPSPKPRHIEKDVKVFHWSILGRALDKIISKYSLYSQTEEASVSTSAHQPLTSSGVVPPAPIVPSQPAAGSYRPIPSSDGSFFPFDQQYSPDLSHFESFYGADNPWLGHPSYHYHADPTGLNWPETAVNSLPRLSPSPSPSLSSSTTPELHPEFSGFDTSDMWPEDMVHSPFVVSTERQIQVSWPFHYNP